MQNTTAIILAAGRGKRMGQLTAEVPKPLLRVGEKTLLEHTINFVKNSGVDKIIIIGGYRIDQIRDFVAKIDKNIQVVENKNYHLQTLSSVNIGLEQIKNGGVFICNADYVKGDSVIEAIRNNRQSLAVFASSDIAASEDEMKVKIDDNGYLLDISKKLTDFQAVYTGDFFCDEKYLNDFKKAVKYGLRDYNNEIAVTEHAFLELKKLGREVSIVDVGPHNWYETDTPEELAKAEVGLNKMNKF